MLVFALISGRIEVVCGAGFSLAANSHQVKKIVLRHKFPAFFFHEAEACLCES